MKFSKRLAPIEPSATLAITSKAKAMKAQGKPVIGFGAGEPDFPTPPFVVDAMVKAARDGATGYAPVLGLPALRGAVARHFTDLYDTPFEASNIAVSVGGKHSLYNLFQILVDPGDEVIVPAPYWVSYPAQIRLAEGEPVIVDSDMEQGFVIRPEDIEAAITDRTVGIVLNSPANPSGAVQPVEVVGALADLAERHDLWLITDDIYSHIRYDDSPFINVLRERPDLRDRIIVVHGASKTYAMTGWRIGFTAARTDLIAKMGILQGQSTSNPTHFAQHGALAAIESDHSFLVPWLSAYDARRRRLVEMANAIEGVSCFMPGGAFYAFPDLRGVLGKRLGDTVIDSSMKFCEALLEHAMVAAVPGEPFGAPGFMRVSYACSMEDVETGMTRIAEFIGRLE
jgi:aspartate aminotransferase